MAEPRNSSSNSAYGGLGPTIVGVVWTECALASLFVSLQLYSRLKVARFALQTLLWIGLAWIAAFVAQVIVTLATANGLGNHHDLIPPANQIQYGKLNTVWEIPSTFAVGFSKMAAVALLLSLQGQTRRKWGYFLIFLGVSNLLGQPVAGFMAVFECVPATASWSASINGHCMPAEPFGIYTFVFSAWSALCDFFLALYPISLFYNSNMRLEMRIGVCTLLGFGVLSGICASLKTWQLYRISETEDNSYSSAPLVIWQFTEMSLILICLSVPALRPLVKHASQNISSSSVKSRLLPSSLRRRFNRTAKRSPSSESSDRRPLSPNAPSVVSNWTDPHSMYSEAATVQEKMLRQPKSIEDGIGVFRTMELRPESNAWDSKTIQELGRVVTRS